MYSGKYFHVDDFKGGYAGNLPSTQLSLNQAYDLDNIVIKPMGKGFRTRLGNAALNGTAMDSGAVVQGIGDYTQSDGDNWLIVVCGTKIFKSEVYDGTMDDITGAVSITAGDNHWDIFTFNDVVYGFGGPAASPNAAWKWAGSGNATALSANPPVSLAGAFSANNRVFGWAGSTMYWSILGNAEDWTGTGSGSATIGSLADNESITGAQVISTNYVLVFKKGATYQMVISSSPFPVYSLFDNLGAVGKGAKVNADGIVYFIAANGRMYSTNGEGIQEYPKVADDLWNTVLTAYYPHIMGFRQKGADFDWIVWLVTTTGTTNNKAIIWDLENKCWLQCTTGYKMNVVDQNAFGKTYMGGYDGKIYVPNTAATYADASETAPGTITGYWQSGWISPDNIDKITQVRKLGVVYYPRASGNITVSYGYDGSANVSSTTLAQTVAASEVYGEKSAILSGRGNTFEFKISQSSSTIDSSIQSIILSGKSAGQKDQAED